MTASLRFGRAELRLSERQLLVDGRPVGLGARAFDLLLALLERRDRIVAKNELLDCVWPGLVVEENNLQVQISSLRKALGPKAIATIPGRGYRFTAALDGEAMGHLQATAPHSISTSEATDTHAAPLSNLPVELPPLYGRAEDLLALGALIELHKLVTVVGAGGIGKTALALALAHRLVGSFADGVWRVELAPVADASLLPTTVARVLHVELGAAAQIETMAKALSTSRMLIVLDNCEHLLNAVAEVAAALLSAAPNVRLLATSQEPLRIAQEHVYRLGALALPVEGGVESARQAGAVALFEARAQAAAARFALTEHNIAAVVDICRHLDGIALAIELAAARVPLLGVDGLRARLDERFRVLTGGPRLALQRHQTLRAALDWSHGLLTQDEQTVFRRLGVFVGSFSLESAQRVTADNRIDEWAVLDHLGALVDKSLVVAETGEEPRYRLLETSRAFALEKLQQAGEAEAALRRQAEAMLAVFEGSLKDEYLLSTQARLERYLPDLDNARAALDWSVGASGDAELWIALTGAIAWLWVSAGLRPEGMRRSRSAMARIAPSTAPHLVARLLGSWSRLAHPEVGPDELAADARAVELYRTLGDRHALFTALCFQGRALANCRRAEEAEVALHEAEQIFESTWPPALRIPLLTARCWLFMGQGRFEEGIGVGQELLQLSIALDDKRLTLAALIFLEQSAASLGRWEESVALGRAMAERIQRDRSLLSGIENIVFSNLSASLTALGEIDEALVMARRVYPAVEQAGRAMELLDPFALLAFKRGHIGDAARMLGRADMRYATSNVPRYPVEQRLHDTLLHELQVAMPADELSRLMKEGEVLSDEVAVRLALRD
jgi:predicted ATPase/DNA-binding winged helix-turn-helix (wHTH) protein